MKAFTAAGPGPVPRLLLWTSVVVLAVSVVLMVTGAWSIGVTWDESYHVERWRNFADHGWYVIDAQSYDGKPFAGVSDQYVYAPATMAFLHLWNLVFGVDSSGHVSTTADGYLTRHLGIVFLGLVALAGMAVLGRLVLRRWDWGVVAAACLAAIPMWTGHAMFNLKDIPVGTAYIWLTVGLCLLARKEVGGARLRMASVVAVAGGTFLMLGTRPGMWTALFCSVVALVAATLFRERQLGERAVPWWRWTDLVAGLGLAYAGLVALYPHAFLHPWHTAYTSAVASSQFLDIQSSRWFVPGHVLLQMPSLLLAFVLIGIAAALLRMRRTIRRVDVTQVRLTLVGVQLLALPLVTMVRPSPLYGDLRQLLFATPAAALFGAVGIATMVERGRRRVDAVRPEVFAAAGVAALVVPLVAQGLLFPYVYTYYNGLGDVSGLKPNSDYYRGSGRALLSDLPATGRVVCSPLANLDKMAFRISHLDGSEDCRTALVSPIAAFADKASGQRRPLAADEFWMVMFTPGDPPTNCRTEARVTRRGLFGTKQLSVLARCTERYPVLGRTPEKLGTTFSDMLGVFDEGWYLPYFSPGHTGLRVHPDGGSLGFRVPFSAGAVPVEIRTAHPVDPAEVRLVVDGHDTRFTAPGGGISGIRFTVAPGTGTHHVQLRPRDGDEVFLVVTSVVLGS